METSWQGKEDAMSAIQVEYPSRQAEGGRQDKSHQIGSC